MLITALVSLLDVGLSGVGLLGVGLLGVGLLGVGLLVLVRRDGLTRGQAEAALHQSAREFEELYNNAPCGYHSLDAMGTFVRINDTELNLLGYSREEVIGKKRFSDLLTDKSLQVFQQNLPLLDQHGSVHNLQLQMICKDGSHLPVTLNAIALKDAAGNGVMSRATVVDDTDRKQVETLLRQAMMI
ncbi:MAG: PAS domain S-box protein [Leptolyngbyaceae cyanobacterium SL_7_1]|nr:PAS domain S-box protein [Leptolyngbyaceae cyanobacterium SL_7_1]